MELTTKVQDKVLNALRKWAGNDDVVINFGQSCEENTYYVLEVWHRSAQYCVKVYTDGYLVACRKGYGRYDIWTEWQENDLPVQFWYHLVDSELSAI